METEDSRRAAALVEGAIENSSDEEPRQGFERDIVHAVTRVLTWTAEEGIERGPLGQRVESGRAQDAATDRTRSPLPFVQRGVRCRAFGEELWALVLGDVRKARQRRRISLCSGFRGLLSSDDAQLGLRRAPLR